MLSRHRTIPIILLATLICIPMQLLGEGFRNPPASARGVGRISGNTPHIDDPSAIAINPANLVDLEHSEVMGSVSFGYATVDYSPDLGPSRKSKDPWAALPSLFAVWQLEDSDMVAGLGLTIPFGRFTKFDDDIISRYGSPTYALLGVVDLRPAIAMKLSEKVSLGLGVDIYYSEAEFRQFIPWSLATGVPTAPDGKATYEGDGTGFGGNVGLTVQMTEKQRVALTYKSPFDIDYSGDFEVDNVPPPLAGIGVTPESDFDTEFKFPTIVALGYGIQVTDAFRVGFEVEWLETSRFDGIPVDIKNNNVLLPSRTIPQDWKDHWTYGFGFDLVCSENWTLRGGYMYLESPMPSDTIFPTEAENDMQSISVGLGYDNGDHAVDLAYMLSLSDDQSVSGNPDPTLNGEYEFESHFVSVSYSKRL